MVAERDGALLDFAIWRPGLPDGVGDIHRGRIAARMPAMAGSFVALDGAEGFLPDSEGGKDAPEGTILPVRIVRAAMGNKGPRLTAKVKDPVEAGSVGLVARGPNPIQRFAARWPDAEIWIDDAAIAAGLPRQTRIVPDAFDDDIAAEVEALEAPVVELIGGGRLSIYPTPALVAIDTDTGGRSHGHAAFNRAVLPAIAREIRLRNLSGAIIVDLAGMPVRKRASLAPDFEKALSADPLRPKFLGFTALGLAEIQRTRIHPPLHELSIGPHAAGLAALRTICRDFDPNPRLLPALRAAPSVVEALRRDPVALADMARRAGRALTVRADPALVGDRWLLEAEHG